MTEDTVIRVEWLLPVSDARAEVVALENSGGRLEQELAPFEPSPEERDKYAHAAFEPLTFMFAAMTVAFLADRLARFIKDIQRGGLIIDLTTSPATIREEGALDQGDVYVVSSAGVEQISRAESVDILAAIRAGLNAGGS